MGTTCKRPQGRCLRALTTTFVPALLAALLLAGPALAVGHEGLGKSAAKPGKPVAKAPKGTIASTTPTFKWSKARGAAKYELRAYEGKKLLLKKSGLTKRSWKCSRALPTGVALTWKVRATNARGPGAWSRSARFKILTGSPAKALTALSFEGLAPPVVGTIDEDDHTIDLTVPYGTSVTALVASFTTTGASVAVGATPQVSGVTANDFSSPVTFTVTAVNTSTQDYVVTVTVAPSPAKAITAFSFASPPATGVIDETLHTVALAVPYGTNVSALVATFSTTGASVTVGAVPQVSGLTPNDFTTPVTYTVTAADGTTQAYAVTVTIAANPAKAITAFSFASPPAGGTINEAAHSVALTVPFGTDLSALVPTITISGASVSPASGVAHSFAGPATYTVTAADGTTQAYVVTVTTAAPVIGQSYGGGKIAYVLQSGDPGYVAGQWQGLIAAAADQGTAIAWSNITATLIGAAAQGASLGTGQANTAAIVAQPGCTGGAAYLCYYLTEGGYSDWYLPSKDELNKLYLNRAAIGGLVINGYWTSHEYAAEAAWSQSFFNGSQFHGPKAMTAGVRAVRAFPPSPAKAISAFSFASPPATGAISEAAHTVALTVPFGTDRSALVPTIAITGVSVSPSFGAANDFTSPRTYTVTAADGTTQAYTVTVTFAAPVIGQSYEGGKIAYVLQPGDPGYAAAQWHGLIAAAADQSTGIAWSNVTKLLGGTGTALGTGDQNTKWIVNQDGCTSGAAHLCVYLVEGGYRDWYLPSKDELNKLYLNQVAIGGFGLDGYWSSSEDSAAYAWLQGFVYGYQNYNGKNLTYRVRAVRDF